ncbi:hypothetical protein BGZ51_005150 [Haplosporangium sp. Z 767]|nr:hypothetical protein BGZ51_005150 [Haplosporangium sp. Z 767]
MVSKVNELSEMEQSTPDKETADITRSVPLDSDKTSPTRRRSPRNHASKPVTRKRTIEVHRTNAETKHDGGSLNLEREVSGQSDQAVSAQNSSKKRRKADDSNDSEDYTDNYIATSTTTPTSTITAASSPMLPDQFVPDDEFCRTPLPWTAQETHYLRQIVGAHSGHILWYEIAQKFTDRTAFECSLRWSQICAEDKRIRRNNKAAGAATLRSISKHINSENEQDTEKNDNPSTKEIVIKTGRWSRSEDKALYSGVEEHLRTYGLEALPPAHLPSDADLQKTVQQYQKTHQSTQPAGGIRSTRSGWCSQSNHSRSTDQSSDESRYSHDGAMTAFDDGSELFDEIVDTSYVENNNDDDGSDRASEINVKAGANVMVTGDGVYRHMRQKSIINPDENHPSEFHESHSATQAFHAGQPYRWHQYHQGDSKSYMVEKLEAMTVSPRQSELHYQPEQWCRDGEERAVNEMNSIHESVQETAMRQQLSFQRSQKFYLQRQGGTTWSTVVSHPTMHPGSPLLSLQGSMPTLSSIDGASLTSTRPHGYGHATGFMESGACPQSSNFQGPQSYGDGWNASTSGNEVYCLETAPYCFNVGEIRSHHQVLEYGNIVRNWNDTNSGNINAQGTGSRDESGYISSDDASTDAVIYNLQFAISQLQQSRELKTRRHHQEPIQLHQKQEQESRGQPSDPSLVAQPYNLSALSSSPSSSFSSMISFSPEWLKSTLVSPRSVIPMTSASSTELSTASHSSPSSPQATTHTVVQSAMGAGGIGGKDFETTVLRRMENTREEKIGQSNEHGNSHISHANTPPTTTELDFNKNLKTREEYTLAISRAMATCPWNLITRSSIPGRTGVQAQARWSEALDPQVKKGKWSPEEDALLLKGAQQSQKCWIWIADGIPGRTQRQCRTRWVQISARYEREAAAAAAVVAKYRVGNGQPLQAPTQ